MFHYELTIPHSGFGSESAESIDISVFSMPVLDSRMYVIRLDRELLIIDPNLWDETDTPALKQLCDAADHATVLVTHAHYDHIAGVNSLREMIPVTLYTNELCNIKIQDSHKNLAAYSMALVMDKTEERQRYCEQYFDFDYGCTADEIYEGSLKLQFEIGSTSDDSVTNTSGTRNAAGSTATSLYVRTIPTPGHSDCSQCIELWHEHHLWAVFTGDSLVNGHDVITRFPSGSKKVFREITEPYLMKINDETTILPGHGDPASYGELKEYGII